MRHEDDAHILCKRYLFVCTSPVLEDEITTGLNQLESPADHCLVYIRNIKDTPTHTINDLTMRFTDVNTRGKKPQIDETARGYLRQMKTNIRNRLADTSALRSYETTMKEYVLKEAEHGTKPYLEQFCEDIIHDVKDMVQKAQEHWWVNTGQHQKLYLEVTQHAKKCQQRAAMVMGRHEQLAAIQNYIRNPTGRPLILHGPFGMGKSALMAKTVRLNREWLGKDSVVVARFLGITSVSNSIKSILQSVISQLCAVYNLEVPVVDVMESTDKMSRAFANLLGQVSKFHGEKAPLTILLDGLDTILPAHRAYGLSWLPLSLPPHIRLMVSTDAYRYGILHRLRQRLPNEQDFVDVSALMEKTVEDIFVRTLQKRNRQVTSDQRELLMRLIKGHPRPIYTNIMTNEALTWGCYTNVPVSMLPEITEDAIWRLLVRTENKLGPVLLQHFFSFLTVVPHGLTEVELRDALSCSDEVMQEVVSEYDIPTEDSLRMPSFLMSQLLNEVKWFLSERDMDGKTIIVFHHAIYKQVCSRKYFANDNMFGPEAEGVNKICKALVEVFLQENGIKKIFYRQDGDQRGDNLNRHVMRQPLEPGNIRKLKLLPFLIAYSGNFHEIRESLKRHCLCNFKWLMCKLQSMPVDMTLLDFSLVEQRDNDLDLVRDFLMQNQSVLRQNPASLGSQLLGCIPRLGSSYRYAMELLDQTRSSLQESTSPMLVPLFPSFPSAHELCKAEMWGLAELMVIDRSMQLGVVRSKDSAIEIWDIRNAELVHQLGVRQDKVTSNIFCSDTYVLSLNQSDLCIWEIESGMSAYEFDLEDLLRAEMATYMVIAYTKHFEHVAIHASDDDFNQLVAIIDTRFKKTQILRDFVLADEFYQKSAVFTDGAEELIFINSTSKPIVNDFGEEETGEVVNLFVYSAINHKYKHKLECGHKKFHSLQLRDRVTVLLCWDDASFDMYDITQGINLADMPAPGHNLTLHQCCFNKERDLLFLASQSGQNSSCFSALWLWDVEDQQLTRLLLQEHNHTEQVSASADVCFNTLRPR